MTQTHTPGPWKIDVSDAPVALKIRYSDGELASNIARIHAYELCAEHGDAMGNARLIAAAPAMLDALKALVFRVREHGEDGELISFGDSEITDALEAIAQAEGA